MAPRKRKAPLPATAQSAKKSRDERVRRRGVIRDLGSLDRLTELNSVDSPLLHLPPEIRDMIFTYVFSGEEYLFRKDEVLGDALLLSSGRSFTELNMSLLLVSRQAHAETALLPYKLNTICFHFEPTYLVEKLWVSYIATFLEKRSLQQIEAIVDLQTYMDGFGGSWNIISGSGLYWANRKAVFDLFKKSL
ncbi:hypothetical protein J4E81_003443 [Alternaria sp. BMP 2799]|nr:hypothetical protein J4E81_003443 [Alternaria sp. BMP 2799]